MRPKPDFEIDPDEIEQVAEQSGRHWKEVLRERLSIVPTVRKSIKQLIREVNGMPLGNAAPTNGSINHDDHLYGPKK